MKLVRFKRSFPNLPRKLLYCSGVLLVILLFFFLLFHANTTCYSYSENKIIDQNLKIDYLKSLVRAQDDYIDSFKGTKLPLTNVTTPMDDIYLTGTLESSAKLQLEVAALLKNIAGTRTADGFHRKDRYYYPFYLNQLMPHMTRRSRTLRPAFLISAGRRYADVVIGVPTVKRDAESYLMATLHNLVENLLDKEINSTLIIVSIGESDQNFIVNTALEIEKSFGEQLDSGLIDVIAPAPSYYPNFEMIPPTLGDSGMRHQWRTKQNLDVIFTMAYAHSKGSFYLMLEDDVIVSSRGYISLIMTKIRKFSVSYPRWITIRFGGFGGFGNLFRSANLIHLISYLQLFYAHMPIDYLIQDYVDSSVCTPFMKMSPIFDRKLFFPHKNPPVSQIICTINSYKNHTIENAYNGLDYFRGQAQDMGDVIRFEFEIPTLVQSYKFRTGNGLYIFDTLHNAVVDIKLARTYSDDSFIPNSYFNEFGFARSSLSRSLGHLEAIQIRTLRKSEHWIVISEIEIKTYSDK